MEVGILGKNSVDGSMGEVEDQWSMVEDQWSMVEDEVGSRLGSRSSGTHAEQRSSQRARTTRQYLSPSLCRLYNNPLR